MKKILFLLLISLIQLVLAEEPVDSLKTNRKYYHLDGIRVVAESPKEAIGSITSKITKPEEFTVKDAVEDVSGIDISSGGKSGSTLSIRGFNQKQIKVLLDGRPLGSGYFGDMDLNTIPLSEIKEIQVLKGPVSSMYGTNTMGGVINIITGTPNNQSKIKFGTTIQRNNTNKIYLSSAYDYKNWNYWLYLSRFHTDGKVMSEDFEPTVHENGGVMNHSASEQYDFQGRVNFTLFDFHSLGFQFGHTFFQNKEIPSSINQPVYHKFLDWKRYQFSTIASFYFTPYLIGNFNVYYDQYDDTYAKYNDANYEEINTNYPSYLESWTFGISQKYSWELGNKIKTIFGHRYEKHLYNRKDNNEHGSYYYWFSNHQQSQQFFSQWEYNPGKFSFTLGSGVHYFTFSDAEKGTWNWQPSLGIQFQQPASCNASFAWGINQKEPTLQQLFSSNNGNPELLPEKAQKWETQVTYPFILQTVSGSLQSTFFYNKVENLINKNSAGYQNIANFDSYGTELDVKFKWLWESIFSYAYTDFESDFPLEIPKHTFFSEQKIELFQGIFGRIKSSWKSKRDVLNDNEAVVTLPAFWLHNVYLSKNWKKVKAQIGLENIFDLDYQDKYGYPGEGRNFVLSLEVAL
jgi:iron complex outermembrane receptor protein/outer membrane receptor for ferrienterochelin and colicins